MPVFTKTHAEDTAKKLKTKPKGTTLPRLEVIEIREGSHLMQYIWCDGVVVNKFGIKHGSNRNASHGWVGRSLNLHPNQMHAFAICNMSIDDMISHFIADGVIDGTADGNGPEG
jgi:hypothetical protein